MLKYIQNTSPRRIALKYFITSLSLSLSLSLTAKRLINIIISNLKEKYFQNRFTITSYLICLVDVVFDIQLLFQWVPTISLFA
jgi:hypothetical protein